MPAGAGQARTRLGRGYRLDGELAEAIERLPGVASVRLEPLEPLRLARVG